MPAAWKDVTSYSRDRERIPGAWATTIGDLQISVVKGHIYHPGKWVVHCEPWFNAHEIADDSASAEAAQHLALDAVRTKVIRTYAAFEKL